MEQYEAFKRTREARAKSDLIGTIFESEIYELLGFHRVEPTRETESWEAFTKELENVAGDAPVNKKNNVEDRAHDFGNEREETGFRIGFHIAMRLCMEGLNGGVR